MAKNKRKRNVTRRKKQQRERERTVDVELETGGTVKIVVKKPSNQVNTESQRIGAKVWTDCIRDGIMTKKELEKVMYKTGVWDKKKDVEQEEIVAEIHKLEKLLYLGKKGGKMKVSEAKNIAIDMRTKRIELRDLLAERIELESMTAESLSDNAKFDYLVANCTFYEDGRNVYNSLEDYNHMSEDQIAFHAASNLAEMMYAVDKDFEKSGFPNKKLEDWKFSDFKDIVDKNFEELDTKKASSDISKIDLLKDFEHNYILLVNGNLHSSNFDHEDKSKIKINSYDKTIDYKTSKNPLVCLNHALAENGYFLEVVKNYKFKKVLVVYNFFKKDAKNKILNKKKIWKYGPYISSFYKRLLQKGNCLSTSASLVKKEFLLNQKILFNEKKK